VWQGVAGCGRVLQGVEECCRVLLRGTDFWRLFPSAVGVEDVLCIHIYV